MPDGTIVQEGGNIEGASMVSLTPTESVLLPQHDIVGLPFKRRFNRGFVKGLGGGLKEYVYCIVCEHFRLWVKSSDGAVLVTPADYELYL